MPTQDGLRFLFDIQDKITGELVKIERQAKASAKNIDSAFGKASRTQENHLAKIAGLEQRRVSGAAAASQRLTALEEKRVAQGKILAQRLSAAQSREARQAANFRIAAARRAAAASAKAERETAAAVKARARVALKAEKDHERAVKARAREQQRAYEKSAAIARKAILGLTALGGALLATSVKLAALGSRAEETENVTGLAFGAMKGAAQEWAAEFAKATGSSRFESIELVSDLGLIVKGMGFTEQASLGMSSRMVELAADMASAKNVPLDVALDKIRAGLIGESEPLRTMGVLLSEARVKQEAYTSGLAETGTELTNTQKVQARMNIILADSAAMHGDLINTQDSVANQWRAIKNTVFDAATALGQELLPIASDVLGVLGEWVTKGADLLTWITESEARMKAFGAILAGVVVTGLGLAGAALWALVPAVTAATGGINLLIPLIAVGVGALVTGWILFGDTVKDFLRRVWGKLMDLIGAGLRKLSKFVGIFNDDWAAAMASAGEGLQETARASNASAAAATQHAAAQKDAAEAAKLGAAASAEAAEAAAKAAALAAAAAEELAKEQAEAAAAAKKHAEAAEKQAEKIADLAQKLQGLPTKAVTEEFEDLREAWASLGTEAQAASMDAYGDILIAAGEAGHKLDAEERAMNATRRVTLILEAALAQASKDRKAANDKRAAAEKKALADGVAALELLIAGREAAAAAGAAWADAFFSTLSRAFEGGSNLMGALKSSISSGLKELFAEGGPLAPVAKAWGDAMEAIGGIPVVGPFLKAFGPVLLAGLAKIGQKLGEWLLGGPSAMEIAGREAAAAARDAIVATLTDGQIAEAAGNAGAAAHIAMRDAFLASGQSLAEAEAQATSWVARLHAAEMQGADAVAAVQAQMMEILGEVAAAAAEAAALMDSAISATVNAYDRAKAAGVAAYDEVFEAALASGKGQKEATAMAEKAQDRARKKLLREEKAKYVRLAVMEAVLEAIRSGNAEGAAEAGRKAAKEVSDAWKVSMGIIEEADETTTDVMNDRSKTKADKAISEAKRAADGVNNETARILDRTVSISYHGERTGTHGAGDGDRGERRQHGGPVGAGRPYLVGERGPEMFVPSQSGRIEPHGSAGGAGVDPKALARAVADALEGTRVDVDGRQLGRLTIRHQPLAVAELGGRR